MPIVNYGIESDDDTFLAALTKKYGDSFTASQVFIEVGDVCIVGQAANGNMNVYSFIDFDPPEWIDRTPKSITFSIGLKTGTDLYSSGYSTWGLFVEDTNYFYVLGYTGSHNQGAGNWNVSDKAGFFKIAKNDNNNKHPQDINENHCHPGSGYNAFGSGAVLKCEIKFIKNGTKKYIRLMIWCNSTLWFENVITEADIPSIFFTATTYFIGLSTYDHNISSGSMYHTIYEARVK